MSASLRALTTDEELDEALAEPVALLYKHSTRCGISSGALREMERFAGRHPTIPVYLLDVITDRQLADRVASVTGVRHESPQVIVVEAGTAGWNASHFRVSCKRVEAALERCGVLTGEDQRASKGRSTDG